MTRVTEEKSTGKGSAKSMEIDFPCHTEVTWVPERDSLVERQRNFKN